MNTQLELLKILNATNNYYKTPGTKKWLADPFTDAVTFWDNTRNIEYWFSLQPETLTLEITATHNNHKLLIFTPTMTLGNHRFAPDIVIAIHNAFKFEFASDAIFVVQDGRISRIPNRRRKTYQQKASDAIVAGVSSSSSFSSASSSDNHSSGSSLSLPGSLPSRLLRWFLFLRN